MKILIVDDHALIREALRGVLMELDQQADIVEASEAGQAMRLVEEQADFDVVLLDLNLPDRDGFSVLAELRARHPAIFVVVLSAAQDRANVARALDLGALGFIPKSAQRQVMVHALQLVLAGGIYIPPQMLQQPQPHAGAGPGPRHAGQPPLSGADLGLSERQVEVLTLMMQGKSNKTICRALGLSEPTVKKHVTGILKALNVTNRTEAVIAIGELGWKAPPLDKS